jgi:NAD-dependent deacetylase
MAAEPNDGHRALVDLERLLPRFMIVTQNVDGLHVRAGSQNVLEIHGSIIEARCMACGADCPPLTVSPDATVPARCSCGGLVRPSVVWFGEMLDEDLLEKARLATLECDVFLSVGTGADVYPAASLPLLALDQGAYVLEVNPAETAVSQIVHEVIRGTAANVLPEIVRLAQPVI